MPQAARWGTGSGQSGMKGPVCGVQHLQMQAFVLFRVLVSGAAPPASRQTQASAQQGWSPRAALPPVIVSQGPEASLRRWRT
eukprot:13059407-Alexandrium_andersonii.AAC.1